MKKLYLTNLLLVLSLSLIAQTVPKSYYSSIDGLKKENLKLALGKLIANHTKRSYSSQLATDYKSIYVVTGTTQQVYDLYSNEVYNYSSTSKWNKEHTVANSYWGGSQNNAYSDLFSVIPSLATANSRKSNYPPAELATTTYDSGRIKIGKPVSGQGGNGYTYAWEPYDEFKGDFARIIMYVATCYYNISWNTQCPFTNQTWPTMDTWLYKLMLKWHNQDPVCEKEMEINDAVQGIQKNRNPFIDYPILADYIWGELTDATFDLETAVPHQHYGGDTPTTAFSVTPTTIDMGAVVAGTPHTVTFTVTPQHMVDDITISTTLGTLSTTKIAKSATAATVVTLTYTPDLSGAFSGTVTVTDGQNTRIVHVSGTAYSEIPEGEDGDLYVKVTSEPVSWKGKYLIVYEKKGYVMDGAQTAFDGKEKYITLAISDNAIRSTNESPLGTHAFTIEENGDGYSIKSASGYYLGHSSKELTQSESTKTKFNISLEDGIYDGQWYLRFNSDALMFRFYKSGQQAIALYRAMQLGDVNHDGAVNAADIPALISFMTSEQESTYIRAAADLDGDGSITDADLTLLKNTVSYCADAPIISGVITKSIMDKLNGEWSQNDNITTIDLTGVTSLDPNAEVKTYNPNAMIYIPAGMSLANNKNVIAGDVCDNLALCDGYAYNINNEFIATKASYQRSLTDEWETICLPYAVASNSDCKYYRLKGTTSTSMILEPVEGLAACEPGIFQRFSEGNDLTMGAQDVRVSLTLENPEVETNDPNYIIVGCLSERTWTNLDPQSNEGIFYLNDNKILRGDGTLTLPAFRAYFAADNVAGIEDRGIKVEEATGITNTVVGIGNYDKIYNMSGQQVDDSYKGMVVKNGRIYRNKQ